MKKSRIKQIVREVLTEEKGYSKYVDGGKTDGLTQDTLEKILLKIARQGEEIEEEKYEGDPERGNKILDTADPENVARILRGEDEVDRMQELAGIQKEIKVNNPIQIKLEDTVEGQIYNFDIKPEEGEGGELEVLFHDMSDEGPFIIVKHVGDSNEDSFELYSQDIISIKKI